MYSRGVIIVGLLLQVLQVVHTDDPFWRNPVPGGWATLEEVDAGGDVDDAYEAAICRTLRCRKGEECVVRGRVAECQCKRTCPHNDQPVCASDGVTYNSHCHLHRQACISGVKLHTLKHGSCEEAKSSELLPVFPTSASANNGRRVLSPSFTSRNTPMTPVPTSPTYSREEPNLEGVAPMSTAAAASLALTMSSNATCSNEDFFYVPSNLLLYFHAKYAESASGESPEKGKSYLVHLMYNHFDLNADQLLTADELQRLDDDGKYLKLMPTGCRLMDILKHADDDGDGRLNEKEFFRLFGLPVAFISPHNEIKVHRVEVGQQYQLFCDIEKYNSASLKVTWYRYDVPLVNVAPYDFEVSADGSLYLTPVSLTHNGNFTCRVPLAVTAAASATSELSNGLQQVHVVHVFERARISVTPDFLLLKTGESGYLQCDVEGYPVPKISWEKNGRPFKENVSVLQLTNARTYDTGSYRCGVSVAPGADSNGSGSDTLPHRSASVVVRDRYDQPEMALRFNSRHNPNAFFALYESGVRLFRADDCTLLHAIPSSYPMSEEKQGYLCRDRKCHWSDAVVTQSSYLYAALSSQMALVKINVTSGAVEQYFHLNHIPMKLQYIESEDSIWIEGWHESNGNYRTVQVIRSASKAMRHTLTHALPLRDEFDAVHRIFLPTSGRLKYGYVTHLKERTLHKIDLHNLKIVSRVSLVPYDCQPNEVAFISQVGLAVVQCAPGSHSNGNRTTGGGQLILDYISDTTLDYGADVHGVPVVTEDGRWLVNIDSILGRVFVHKVDEKGVRLVATIDEFLPITDWTLHQSITFSSWDLFVAPLNGIHLVKISVPDAKIERMTNTEDGQGKPIILASTSRRNRYLTGATAESVFSTDLFNSSNAKCRVNLTDTQKIVWAAVSS